MKVALCWELGGGYGHMARLMSLASALKEAGHQVIVCARNPALAERWKPRHFDEVVPAPTVPEPLIDIRGARSLATFWAASGFKDSHSLEPLLTQWLRIFQVRKPSLIICDYAPLAMFAAHLAGIACVRIGTGFFNPSGETLPDLRPWLSSKICKSSVEDAVADTAIRETSQRWGRPCAGLADLLKRTPSYLTSWPETDHCGGETDGRPYYGPLAPLTGGSVPDWPTAPGPKIFVYMPFRDPVSFHLATALETLGWPTIWHAASAPRRFDRVNICPQPVMIEKVLAEATLFVGRAGHGATCEALRAGRPQLMIPDQLEAALLAYRMGRQGFGTTVAPQEQSADIVRKLVSLASDTAMLRRIERSSQNYRSYDGLAESRSIVASACRGS